MDEKEKNELKQSGTVQKCYCSPEEIFKKAQEISEEIHFQPGDCIVDFIESLGGKIHKQNAEEWNRENSPFVEIKDENHFIINVPDFRGLHEMRKQAARGLGHYYLHSDRGSRPMTINHMDECAKEADLFARLFLIPEKLLQEKIEAKSSNCELACFFRVNADFIKKRIEDSGAKGNSLFSSLLKKVTKRFGIKHDDQPLSV